MIELTETMNDLKKNLKQKELQLMPSIGKNISDFCYDHSIKNVIFLDRSARPAYQTLKETWRQNYKDEIRPNIYFISPKIMENVGVDDEGVKLFKKEQPYLAENKQATLIFDVCVKSGLTLYNMTKLLEKSDFKEVYSMVTARHIDEKLHLPQLK